MNIVCALLLSFMPYLQTLYQIMKFNSSMVFCKIYIQVIIYTLIYLLLCTSLLKVSILFINSAFLDIKVIIVVVMSKF